MSKIKIVALFGESASGKTSLAKKMAQENADFNFVVPTTTRPKRDNEIDGIDYHFAFDISLESCIEVQCFNGWYYGTPLDSLSKDKINIGAFSLKSLNDLMMNKEIEDIIEIIPIYIYAQPKTRLLRSVKRCSEDEMELKEVCRRFLADYNDFSAVHFPHYAVNNNGTKTDTVNQIYSILNI